MLVLTRKTDQGLRIFDVDGRYIGRVVVLGVDRENGRVKLGVDADPRFVVLRDELVSATTKRTAMLDGYPVGDVL